MFNVCFIVFFRFEWLSGVLSEWCVREDSILNVLVILWDGVFSVGKVWLSVVLKVVSVVVVLGRLCLFILIVDVMNLLSFRL